MCVSAEECVMVSLRLWVAVLQSMQYAGFFHGVISIIRVNERLAVDIFAVVLLQLPHFMSPHDLGKIVSQHTLQLTIR